MEPISFISANFGEKCVIQQTFPACCILDAPKRNGQGQAAEGAKMERSQMAARRKKVNVFLENELELHKMEAAEGAILERFGKLQGKG
jgi:hypothetical protein